MRFGSVCSGIEAASVAWEPLGWEAAWFSEIEPFPCAVLAHHYPSVPNLGDMTTLPNRILGGEVEAPDVFCGGTPCQAFSVAGKRQSLDDARGNLSLVFCEIANAIDDVRGSAGQQPTIVFWENVPGVLSTKDNAFGCFLGELAGEDCQIEPTGGKWSNAGAVYGPKRTVAWRVLDAQYFGVAQRRRRVFVVASARTDIDPAAILFEFDGLRRDIAPSRETGKVAPAIPERSSAGGGLGANFDCDGGLIQTFGRQSSGEYGTQPVASTVSARDYKSASDLVAQPINFSAQMSMPQVDIDLCQTLGAKNPQAVAYGVGESPDVSHCLRSGASRADKHESTTYVAQPVSFDCASLGGGWAPQNANPLEGMSSTLTCTNQKAVAISMQVRRLTPVECERLQGFPDNYTNIPWRKKPESPDGPRYKALGNSWAVPNVRWIGERIQLAVEIAGGAA